MKITIQHNDPHDGSGDLVLEQIIMKYLEFNGLRQIPTPFIDGYKIHTGIKIVMTNDNEDNKD
jgi:hypothetical protein